ncbi:MAG: Lrp/AsnC family transcriptional regulator [Dehalococcoidia bacterium]|nr:Lrp/AsnC family transcriptional regulator [Dehalococcoidia bacterium]
MNNIDATDTEIIKLLSKDGRRSSREIAFSLNLHPATVQRRIARLIADGTLHVLPVVEPLHAGIKWIAFIGLSVSPPRINGAITSLKDNPGVYFLSSTIGRFNIVAIALFREGEMLDQLVTGVIPTLEGIRSYEVMVCHDVEKGRHIYSLGQDDSVEGRLVRLLYRDGRQSVRSLAEKLRLPPPVVRRRLKQMISRGMLRFTAVVDIEKAGPRYIALAGLNILPSRLQEVKRSLAESTFTRFVASTSGLYDALVIMLFSSYDEMKRFIQLELTRIEGIISCETQVCLDIAKGGMVRL